MTAAGLLQRAGYSANIITRFKRNSYVSLESVEKTCRALNCPIDNIAEYISDDAEGKQYDA